MTTKDEALKLALEALEESRNALAWFYDSYPQDVTEKGNELLPHVETVLTAIREALAEQPAQQQEWVACRDEMCACRGGPCTSCPDGEREKELADMRDSRDFYKRRTDELQKAQSQMRDPERTMVCDILANGRLLVPAAGRYNTSPPASASVSVERVEPVPAAMKTIIQAMQQDPEYAWGWHCNIAMAFVDAGGDHYTGNQGAARFMKLLANVEPAHELPSPQPSQRSVEPVANVLPLVIAGAIFDFAGYLTTRDTVIEVGSTANASPVADLVKDWAALRGLSLADAAVLSWQEWLTDVRANDTSKERVDEMQKQRHVTTSPQPSKPWVGLTDEDLAGCDDEELKQARYWENKLKEKNAL